MSDCGDTYHCYILHDISFKLNPVMHREAPRKIKPISHVHIATRDFVHGLFRAVMDPQHQDNQLESKDKDHDEELDVRNMHACVVS